MLLFYGRSGSEGDTHCSAHRLTFHCSRPPAAAAELGRQGAHMPINETLFMTIFLLLLGMVLIWFILVKMLFKRLESAHPAKYEAMGRPSLFLHSSPAGAIAMLKFLVTREHKTLNDSYLSKLSDAMLIFFLVYVILFLVLFFSIAGQRATHAS